MSLLLEYSRISPESKRLAPELGLSWRWRVGLARTSQPHKGRRGWGGGQKLLECGSLYTPLSILERVDYSAAE